MKLIVYDDIKNNEEIRAYIEKSDVVLGLMGYTEHAFDHVDKVARTAAYILLEFGYSEREAELSKIAGFMHDIGNIANRDGHAQSGALIAFNILTRLQMEPAEIAHRMGR